MTIVRPSSPSNNTTPSFSGTASENTEVVVHVFEGGDRSRERDNDGVRRHLVDHR